jgi:hypothetical protein
MKTHAEGLRQDYNILFFIEIYIGMKVVLYTYSVYPYYESILRE